MTRILVNRHNKIFNVTTFHEIIEKNYICIEIMKGTRIPVYFYAFAAMLFWGMSFVWTTILLKYYQPVSIIFIRLVISSCFLFILMKIFRVRTKVARKDIPFFLLSALFNPFLYFIGENYGLKYTTSTITSVIIATIPLFTPVAAWFFFRERLSWLNLTGLIVSFTGILLLLVRKDLTLAIDPKGFFFLIGAVVSAIIYTVLLKKLSVNYRPIILIGYQNLIGVILFMPLFFFFEYRQFISVTPNREIIQSFLFLAFLASSLSFVFFARIVKSIGISKANIFTNLIPVFTAVFSFFILTEQFTLLKVAGILIVIFGVYISETNNKEITS